MSYLLIIHEPMGQRQTRTQAEGEAVFACMVEFGEDLKNQGLLLAMESLAAPDTAARIQVREDRKPMVMDGPFAEAKEFVGGFFLLNCATREQAVEIAGSCPAAQWATVEVRGTGLCFA